jgi:hypothetical protein
VKEIHVNPQGDIQMDQVEQDINNVKKAVIVGVSILSTAIFMRGHYRRHYIKASTANKQLYQAFAQGAVVAPQGSDLVLQFHRPLRSEKKILGLFPD